jgi:repressor LexA
MPEPISKIERRILDYIVDYLRRNTYQPSIREIGRRFGIKSTKTVSEYLQSLADKGYIEREASRSRGVRIVGLQLQSPDAISVPLYGKVGAGSQAMIREGAEEEFMLDQRLAGSQEAFFLQVRGHSMEVAGIFDGDLVLVEPTSKEKIRNEDVVAVRIGEEALVKHYVERDGKIVLESASPGFESLHVNSGTDFSVLGRVTGLFRRYPNARVEAVAG